LKWLELAIYTHEEATEAITERLQLMGAGGVAIEDAMTIEETVPGEYGEIIELNPMDYPTEGVVVKAYFAEVAQTSILVMSIVSCLKELRAYGLEVGEAKVKTNWVDEEDWANAWKEYYKPTKVSKRLVVVPTWEDYTVAYGDLPIYLDPGMAFGTGTHPTTQLALQLMEDYLRPGQEVIDVGCGSGILSIAAEKLGAGDVLALDLDPVAVQKTKENCGQNHTGRVTVREGNLLQGVTKKVDMIVANILAEILQQMMYDLPRVLKPDGVFIGSGIIVNKQAELIEDLQRAGYNDIRLIRQEDWVAVACKR
jgi:ribosomal protein L11 methyltransferase